MDYTLVLSHDNCYDGSLSAILIEKMIKGNKLTELKYLEKTKIIHIRTSPHEKEVYNNMMSVMNNIQDKFSCSKVKAIISVDIGHTKDNIEVMKQLCEKLYIFDHHVSSFKELYSAQKDLTEYYCFDDNYLYIYNLDKASCGIIADYFSLDRVEIVKYIEDYDLYKFSLPYSKEINLAIQSYYSNEFGNLLKGDFEEYGIENKIKWSEQKFEPEKLKTAGSFLKLHIDKEIEAICKKCKYNLELKLIGRVNLVNCVSYKNEVAAKILDEKQDIPCICYNRVEDKYFISIRSRGDVDSSKIAKMFGGGGHKYASGFSLSVKDFENLIIRPDDSWWNFLFGNALGDYVYSTVRKWF